MSHRECSEICPDAWFVNAAAVLHHVAKRDKASTLAKLSGFGRMCVITELAGNHDIPDSHSPSLIYSVWQFYGPIAQELAQCDLPFHERERCINEFIMPEAVTLLAASREERQNYHTTLNEWLDVVHRRVVASNGRLRFQ